MILYRDNPNLGIKTITTANGLKEYRRNCKLIKDEYHIINKDCFEVNGKWYRVSSGFIAFDHEKQEWVLVKDNDLIEGIVSFDKNKPVIGFFSKNIYNNVPVNNYNSAINSDILQENNFIENLCNGVWFDKSKLTLEQVQRINIIGNGKNYNNKGYNIEDNVQEFKEKIQSFQNFNTKIEKNTNRFAKFLGSHTFGAELELSEGNIPENLQYKHGIVMCRDGSITGGEVVTVPMSGAKGLQNLSDIGKMIIPRARVDINCSYHLHIGNIPRDRNYICALYLLGYYLQDEIFQMFPYYKTNPEGIKRKNYCQKLKKLSIHPLKDSSKEGYNEYISDTYEKIFTFLSDGVSPAELNGKGQLKHPISQKWGRASRYFYLNLQNMIFSERRTAEFRIHHATLNPQKLVNWLFICNAMVSFAESHQEELFTNPKKITFLQVLNYYKDNFKNNEDAEFLSNYLKAYYDEKVTLFKKDVSAGDYVSKKDADHDKTYIFKYGGVTNLF